MRQICIFCPDCHGKFFIVEEDVVEGESVECDLCSAQIEIVQESPIKIRLYDEDEYF